MQVYRRIGGLEENRMRKKMMSPVYRRIGGLEGYELTRNVDALVYRRIGGLEINNESKYIVK